MFDKKEYDTEYYARNKEKHSKCMKQWREKNPDYNNKWWEKNPDYYRNYNKKYYLDNKERHKKYLDDNKEHIRKQCKQYRENHREEMKECQEKYYIENKERILERNNKWRKSNNYQKKYRKNNLEKIKENYNQWQKDRRKVDLKFNLSRKMGTAISLSIKGNKAGRHWEDLVGYTLNDLIVHLKKTMPKGCVWQDFLKGGLHIDHILPIRLFSLEEFKQCWSLYNSRLLPKKENLSKRDSINSPILLGLLLKELV